MRFAISNMKWDYSDTMAMELRDLWLTASISMRIALTMGHIMAVAAELDIQNDMKQVTILSPKCKLCKRNASRIYSTSRSASILNSYRRGLQPTTRIVPNAIRWWRLLYSTPSATKMPPRNMTNVSVKNSLHTAFESYEQVWTIISFPLGFSEFVSTHQYAE